MAFPHLAATEETKTSAEPGAMQFLDNNFRPVEPAPFFKMGDDRGGHEPATAFKVPELST